MGNFYYLMCSFGMVLNSQCASRREAERLRAARKYNEEAFEGEYVVCLHSTVAEAFEQATRDVVRASHDRAMKIGAAMRATDATK